MSSKTGETTGAGFAPAPGAGGRADDGADGEAAAPVGEGEALPRAFIRAESEGVQLNLADLWAYRELLYFLTWRDVKVRYKQTLMGVAWVVIQPLGTMLIFTVVFNRIGRLDSGEMPYPLFAYSGLLLWTFFSGSVSAATNSLISNTSLVTKVYFPRAFIPAASVGAGLLDLAVGSVLLAGLAAYYGVRVTWGLLLLPVFVLLCAALALATGMLASALTVKYRDLRHALPFILQFSMFASPVIYPAGAVPGRWRWVMLANPMAGVLEGFRASLGGLPLDRGLAAVSFVAAPLLLALAYYVFRRLEDTFADLI